MTFAVLAEKENSLAHNWFQQAFSQNINWIHGNWYIYNPKAGLPLTCKDSENELFETSKRHNISHLFTEIEFAEKCNKELNAEIRMESRDDARQRITKEDVIPKERIRLAQYYLECMTKKLVPHFKSTEDYSDLKDKMAVDALVNNVYASIMNGKSVGNVEAKLQDAEKAIEIYKNDVEAKAKRIKALEDVIDDKCQEVSSLIKRNIQLSNNLSEKIESQEKIIKNLRQKVSGSDYKINKLLEVIKGQNKEIDQMWCDLNNKTDERLDSLPYSVTAIANAFKVSEKKFPKDRVAGKCGVVNMPQKLTVDQSEKIINNDTSIKLPEPFQGVTIEMSVASKILRGKMNLDDDVEIKIV